MKKILCFDIGGTEIKYALLENTDNIEVKSIKTRKDENTNYILEDVLKIVDEYKNEIIAVGISTAGVVDSKQGSVIFAGPTIPNYTNTKFKEIIEARYSIKTYVENDVNSAAFGEYSYNNYNGSMFCITIGTGVGGALIIDGKLFSGNSMTAGEIGYMPFNNSHFQDYASTTYLTNYVSKKINKEVNGKYIFDNAKKNDKICLEAIENLVDNLSTGILNIIYILNPNKIVIGGGISAQGSYLEDKIVKRVNEKLISNQFKTEITLAKLANSAAIIGIYNIVRKELK